MESSSDEDDSGGRLCERPSKRGRFLLNLDGECSNGSNSCSPGEVGGRRALPSYMLKCWQTEQMARGILDNTLNAMLEHTGQAPEGEQLQLLPVAAPPEHGVEHEAVLMAIQSHGLQRFQRPEEVPPVGLHSAAFHLPSSSSSSGDTMASARLEHDSFLDAAVAVAIQKKGLGVFTSADGV